MTSIFICYPNIDHKVFFISTKKKTGGWWGERGNLSLLNVISCSCVPTENSKTAIHCF